MEQTVKDRASDFIPTGLSLAEQALHLLRRNGATALAAYYIGSLPFALGLLYFWSDMSRNAMAYQYCGPAAAGMALLFVWMKYWQVRFCRHLTCLLRDVPPEPWPVSSSLAPGSACYGQPKTTCFSASSPFSPSWSRSIWPSPSSWCPTC
ncbi:MAG: hypothetical protein P8X55_01465 [Desulfosarcinaceae bacterium]